MGVITWNGVASNTLGIMVEKFPNYNGTKRRYETVTVPGRNGSLLFDLGGYENVIQEYEIAVIGNGPDVARDVRKWLLTPVGYAKLSDTYESGYFRTAYYDGPADIENVLNLAGRATIRFVCGPERYKDSGDVEITIPKSPSTTVLTAGDSGSGIALPLIELRNTSGNSVTGAVHFVDDSDGGATQSVYVTDWSVGQKLWVDSLLKDVYNTQGPANTLVTFNVDHFPEFTPYHVYTIKYTGQFTSVVMKPRWWDL